MRSGAPTKWLHDVEKAKRQEEKEGIQKKNTKKKTLFNNNNINDKMKQNQAETNAQWHFFFNLPRPMALALHLIREYKVCNKMIQI